MSSRGSRDGLPSADRVTIGHPGMVRRGLVEFTPHYIRLGGPHTAVDPDLVIAWTGWEAQRDVAARLGKPSLLLNDAEVHAAAVVTGVGVELFLGLGTGLACAYVVEGTLAPHIELSHAPLRKRKTYDTFVGEAARMSIGRKRWSRRTCAALAELRPVFLWDRLFLGGGGARKLAPEDVHSIGPDVVVVPNEMGIRGGARAWDLFAGHASSADDG